MLTVESQNKQGIGEYSQIEVHNNVIYGYGGNTEISSRSFLGEYKTDERAFQVFCDMKKTVKMNLHNKIYKNQPDEMYNCDSWYEMPEE